MWAECTAALCQTWWHLFYLSRFIMSLPTSSYFWYIWSFHSRAVGNFSFLGCYLVSFSTQSFMFRKMLWPAVSGSSIPKRLDLWKLKFKICCFLSRRVITYKYNTPVNNTTLYLYAIQIVYCHGDMFQPILGHLQALWVNRSKNCLCFNALLDTKCIWDPKMHWNIDSSWICFLRGPQDDLI